MFRFFRFLYTLILSEFNLLQPQNLSLENYLATKEKVHLLFEDIFIEFRIKCETSEPKHSVVSYYKGHFTISFWDERYDGFGMSISYKTQDDEHLFVALPIYHGDSDYFSRTVIPPNLTIDEKVNFQLIAWRFYLLKYGRMFLENNTEEIQDFFTWKKRNHAQILEFVGSDIIRTNPAAT